MTRPTNTRGAVYARGKTRSPITQAIEEAGTEQGLLDVATHMYPQHPLPGGPTDHVVVTFTAPTTPLSVNATNGRHYGGTHLDKLAWRHAAHQAFTDAADQVAAYRGHRIEVTFCLPLTNHTRADGANYASGISVKAAVDGIVAAGVLAPDDRSEWMRVDCVFWAGGPTKDEVRVRVRIADEPWDGS